MSAPHHIPVPLTAFFPLGKTPRVTILSSRALSAVAAPAKSPQRDDPDGQLSPERLCNPRPSAPRAHEGGGKAELPLPEVTGGTWGLWFFLLTHLQPPAPCKTSSTEAIPKPPEAPALHDFFFPRDFFGRFPYSRGDHDLLYKSPPRSSHE